MAELREALRSGQFVLLVGESAAGKSRAAFEAVRELFPDRRFVQPWGRDGLMAALDLAMRHPGCVLWADDLERFLGDGGLTGAAVRGLLAGPGQRRHLVATMRAEEHARFVTGSGVAAGALRDGRDVLHLAAVVNVHRFWSESELARARSCRGDPRIADAVAHAARFGPAEYLAAAPQLLASWQDGWAPGTHPRGAALVMAAVDARRTGIRRPLPVPVLARLHQPYLAARGGALLRPEPLRQALRWATAPLHATSSLLIPCDDDMLLAFDYLVDAIPRDPVPPAAIDALISCATPEEAMEIGLAAWYWGRPDEAEAAFRSAEAGGHGPFEATYRLVRLLQERDGTAAGLAAARAALASRTAALGPGHADTLRARCTLLEQEAMALEGPDGRVPREARIAERFSGLQPDAERLSGPDSRIVAEVRQAVVRWTAVGGEPGKAVSLALGLVSDCQRVFGEDDDTTFASREVLASAAREAGQAEEALSLLQQLIADAERRDGEHGQFALDTRRTRARWLTRSGRHAEAIGEFRALVTRLAGCRGPLHANTLNCRWELAEAVGAGGDPGTAVTMLRQLIPEVAKVSPEGKVPMLSYRRALASWTGEAGDPVSAAAQFAELAEASALSRGDEDSYTRHLREHHARWQSQAPDSSG